MAKKSRRTTVPDAVREYLRDLGRRGGTAAAGAGARARFAAMTKEQRRELARKAAQARWGKKGQA